MANEQNVVEDSESQDNEAPSVVESSEDSIAKTDPMNIVPQIAEEIISKSLISTRESKVGMKGLRDIIKDPEMKADLEDLGVDVDGAARRLSYSDLVEIMGSLSEKLVDAEALGDKDFVEDEKNNGTFEKSADEFKKILGGKGAQSFDDLTDKQQKSLIILIDEPNSGKEKAIQDAATSSREQKLEESQDNEAPSVVESSEDSIAKTDPMNIVPQIAEEIISKSLISTRESKVGMKGLRDIIKDPEMKADLEDLGVDVDGAARRLSYSDLVEIMGSLSEKLVDAEALGDKDFVEDEKNNGTFEKSADEFKKILGGKGAQSFDDLTDKQQKSLIILIDEPNSGKEKAIQDAATSSREQKLEETQTNTQDPENPASKAAPKAEPAVYNQAPPTEDRTNLIFVDNSSFADTLEGQVQATPVNSDIEVNWSEGAQQLTSNFQGNTGTPYVEPNNLDVTQDMGVMFKV